MYRLSKYFPTMTETPEGKQFALGWLYWVFMLFFMPALSSLFAIFFSISDMLWFALFLILNAAAVGYIFRSFLSDSKLNLQLYTTECRSAIVQGLIVLAVALLPVFILDILYGGMGYIRYSLYQGDTMSTMDMIKMYTFFDPVAENALQMSSMLLLGGSPLFILPLVIAAPITTCCLYYAIGFAPAAQRRPWLGYLVVCLIAAFPLVAAWLRVDMELPECIIRYLCQLPFHLCACWVYQRSNTIWAPIIFQGIVNLVMSLVYIATHLI